MADRDLKTLQPRRQTNTLLKSEGKKEVIIFFDHSTTLTILKLHLNYVLSCEKYYIYSNQVHPHTKLNEPKCTKIWENRPVALRVGRP